MDRTEVYVGALPRAEDFLGAVKNAYYAIGHLAEAVIGSATGTNINGFQIAATGTPSMSVTIGRGSIYETQEVDATNAYGVLGTDTNTILKQGINYSPVTLTCTAPSTSGYSQYYLVQVSFAEADANAVVLPYFNSGSPTTPLNGPGGAGSSNYTVRQDQAVVSLVAGTAAPTGSQTIPSPSAGAYGLWVILVSNSTTSITGNGSGAGQWAVYASAPTFPNLQNMPGRLLNVQYFKTGGTYTPTTGANSAIVEAFGGGGGSGELLATGAGQASCGGGGGSGAYARKRILSLSSQTVTIGASGHGGSVTYGSTGTTGGTTSFGSLVVAAGGAGGTAGTAGTTSVSAGGAGAAAPTTGDLNIGGSPGFASFYLSSVAFYGPGGAGLTGSLAGYGAGGQGQVQGASTSANVGIDGQPGIVIVWDYA